MKAVRKNGVTTLTLEKPELKVLRKAHVILAGVAELAPPGESCKYADDGRCCIAALFNVLGESVGEPAEKPDKQTEAPELAAPAVKPDLKAAG